MKRRLTKEEQEAVAKVETGYVSMDDDGELLIIDDSNYFRIQAELREQEEEAERKRRDEWGLPQ